MNLHLTTYQYPIGFPTIVNIDFNKLPVNNVQNGQ